MAGDIGRGTPEQPAAVVRADAAGRPLTVPLGMAVLLLGAAVAIAVDVRGYREGAGGEPGPAAIPILVALLCAAAAIALVFQTLRSTAPPGEGAPSVFPVRVIATVATLTAAGLLLEQIGFFVTFTGLAFAGGLLAGARRWWTSLGGAVVITWVVMIFFGRLFAVPLPAGPIDVFLGG
ncbi:hypothetical protein E1262_06380 [Jiangella aurantiaca]|uniref:DUF1468 domain-containing protein n=1 Tax=Jiangella aurantiaca TaxID=2530373 RepID=A0A4R5AF97_9ACTN|nr:hypothetical protein E1262_06380 [Jiangella aurantiaca]